MGGEWGSGKESKRASLIDMICGRKLVAKNGQLSAYVERLTIM